MRWYLMIGNGSVGSKTQSRIALCAAFLIGAIAQAAHAADCPGHPDALGTSRTIVVDPREHPRIGTMQYPETLPLRDHEVVLTFDDGPLPKHSNQVLQTLADQCVKATFFLIGSQARANPEGVRKLVAAGHSIGTHSQNHPLTFQKMPVEKAQEEIDQGIASVTAALTDPSALSPFFRIPGLLRAEGVENYLASRGIQLWSADFLADDWHRISSARVHDLAMKRLEAKGKGILLLHDIQARTAGALPAILHDLKARGYRIVHVVAATPDRPATPTDPAEWQMHPPSENVPIARWPKIPHFVFADAQTLPAPVLPSFDTPDGALFLSAEPFSRVKRLGAAPTAWPRTDELAVQKAAISLPVPQQSLFELPKDARAAFASIQPRREGMPADAMAKGEAPQAAAKAGAAKRGAAAVVARGHGSRAHVAHAAHPARAGTKPAKRAGKAAGRSVRVASLKKRS